MITVEKNTLGEVWLFAMKTVMEHGEDIFDEDISLREVRNLYMTIQEISDSDPILVQYADHDRIDLMKKKYATCGLVVDYKIDYGSYIYNNNGINQIEWIINRIKNKPETKSATITLHKSGEDKLACLSMIDFKYRNSLLDMTVVYRSQNIFWSQPGNMLALRQIQKDVSTALGYKTGKTDLVVLSAHIYEHDFNQVRHILNQPDLQYLT